MSFWSEPKSLEKAAAGKVAETIFKKALQVARFADHSLKSKVTQEEDFVNRIKIYLHELEQWLKAIPGMLGRLEDTVKSAIDDATEIPPTMNGSSIEHIMSMLLKLLFLNSVFIDKDYSCNCGLCLMTSGYEKLTCSILKGYQFKMKKLVVYGAMFPSIVETIISNSTNLRYLGISQFNLTDDLVNIIEKCSKLETLHLSHNYIWLAVSTDALCRGFFKKMSEETVRNNFHSGSKVPISFPALKVVDFGPFMSKFVIYFYQWFLYNYNVQSVCFEWKTCVLEEDRKYITEKIIMPLLQKGNVFDLGALYLGANFLSSLTRANIQLISKSMPNIDQFYVDCNEPKFSPGKAKRAGDRFKELVECCGNCLRVYANISHEEEHTCLIINPLLNKFGVNLSSLIMSSESRSQSLKFKTIKEILVQCPNLKQLKLLFATRYTLSYDTVEETTTPIMSEFKLTEFWMHEMSPWEIEQVTTFEKQTKAWISVMMNIICSSPMLQILSVGTSASMEDILLKINADVSSFHLHFKDGCEQTPKTKTLINMIKRFRKLTTLYLEELDGEVFWKVKKYFAQSGLEIHWGNLGGWPRT